MRGRHRHPGSRSRGLRALAAGMVLPLLVIGGVYGAFRLVAGTSCAGEVRLVVGATPEIAPAVKAAVSRWSEQEPRVGGQCVQVEVVAQYSADVATAVAGDLGLSVKGLGQPDARGESPHVWIPDSSIWLQRMRELREDTVPLDAPSIARSPVAIAMPEATAASFGWVDTRLSWATILRRIVTDIRIHPGIVDPNRDSAAISSLVAMASVVPALGPQGDQITVGAVKALQAGRSELPSALLLRFPRDTQARTMASALTLAPLPEQAILAYNAAGPPVRLAALYPEPYALALDFPYTIMPRLAADKAEAAAALRSVLAGPAFRDDLTAQHLRAADGTAGPALALSPSAPTGPGPVAATPEPAVIAKALNMWVEITRPSRMLAVMDVSGSMAQAVPTAGGLTRQQVAVEAAKGGLELFDKSWMVGLWVFSTQLDGERDYRQLVPIGPLTTEKPAISAALDTIQPVPTGRTGLYDTVLAGYKELQREWDPGRGNTLVVITGGRNDDVRGLGLEQVVAELKRAAVRDQPVQIIFIGIGDNVGETELKKITATTGGAVYLAPDPGRIGEIFMRALALMDQ